MKQELAIHNRVLREGGSLFIVAECGVTCNYDLAMTKQLIDVVAESGADGIKLIFWFPDEIMSDHSITYSYETLKGEASENMYDMLSKLRFTLDEWKQIKAYADSKNIVLFSTVNSPTGVLWAEELKLDAYKLSSWDFNDLPLWRRIAKLGKPMIIDTGPVHLLDVARVITLMEEEGNEQALLVHCYHTSDPKQVNMRTIPYMRHAFQTPVGFSSKDLTDEMDIAAVALGVVFLEKRLTIRRDLPGHHHAISKEPDEFKHYVETMRMVHASLGEERLQPSGIDLEERRKWFRHLVANTPLPQGKILTEGDIIGKRGEQGVSPEYQGWFLGRKLKRELKENEAVTWMDV